MKKIITSAVFLLFFLSARAQAQDLPICDWQLTNAAINNYFDTAKAILNAGVNPNCIESLDQKMIPLHWVAFPGIGSSDYKTEQDRIKFAELLFSHNAQLSINDRESEAGETALLFATQDAAPNFVKYLLAHGANPNIQDNDGRAPLHQATLMLNNVEIVDALIQSGANVNLQDGSWQATPLLYAAGAEGHPEVIARILKANPNLEIADKYGRTPLIMASWCYKGTAAVNLGLLLEAGANVNARDNQGMTALAYARQAGDQDAVDLLIKHGAKN